MNEAKPLQLYLLRHALALPSSPSGEDKDRALSPKGLEDASALGKVMISKGYVPNLILCSTATRTRQTLEKLKESLPPTETILIDKLYNGGTDAYIHEAQKIKVKYSSVLLIGHNPCVYEYATWLTGSGRESLMQRLTEGYKPATLSVLSCDIEDWALLGEKNAEILDLMDPLDYNAPSRPTRWT